MLDLELEMTGRRIGAGLRSALRDAVVSGRLVPGTPLPSTRALAADLGVARATVVGVYEQLVAEGYLVSRPGGRTTVAATVRTSAGDEPPRVEPPAMHLDLLPGEPDHSAFPRTAWLSAVRDALRVLPDSALGYGDHRGDATLRRELARYLARTRAVVADPERIVIFPGYTCALGMLAEALVSVGATTIAIEHPCLPHHARAATSGGAQVVPVAVDRDGLRVENLTAEVAAVTCTPTHQYPMGVVLAPPRRAALVAWARERGGWVVEDDYDGEFRYDRQPVGALQGLDPERVVYAGTASKSMAPGLALAWLVLPRDLLGPVLAVKRRLRPAVSSIEQAALAHFLASGRLDRHVRRMRLRYRDRRDAMLAILEPRFEVIGVAAGLHLTALTDDEDELVGRASAAGIALFGTGNHLVDRGRRDEVERGLVIGYSRPPEHGFREALERLERLLD